MITPVYLAEVAPTKIRGGLVSMTIVATTFGQFAAYIICVALNGRWRLMLGLAAIPSSLQLVGMIFLPETPRYTMKHKSYGDAI